MLFTCNVCVGKNEVIVIIIITTIMTRDEMEKKCSDEKRCTSEPVSISIVFYAYIIRISYFVLG